MVIYTWMDYERNEGILNELKAEPKLGNIL